MCHNQPLKALDHGHLVPLVVIEACYHVARGVIEVHLNQVGTSDLSNERMKMSAKNSPGVKKLARYKIR